MFKKVIKWKTPDMIMCEKDLNAFYNRLKALFVRCYGQNISTEKINENTFGINLYTDDEYDVTGDIFYGCRRRIFNIEVTPAMHAKFYNMLSEINACTYQIEYALSLEKLRDDEYRLDDEIIIPE